MARVRHPALAVLILLGLGAAIATAAQASAPSGKVRVYVGTYTSGDSKGIYRLELDLSTGALTPVGEPAETANPSFLAFHPGGRFLYAVNETGDAKAGKSGGVSAFAIDPATGALTLLNQQSSGGADPCHLSLDTAGKHVLVANYSGGNAAVLPIQADGRLGAATALVQHEGTNPTPRDAGPHAHAVHLSLDNRFAFVADLGLDKLMAYRFDAAKGTLTAHTPPSVGLALGAGPRHFTFDKAGRRAYVINELNGTITGLDYDAVAGTMKEFQTVPTLPPDWKGGVSTAEIVLGPGERFLYGSNRAGHDSLAIYAVDSATGKLTPKGHQPTLGKTPRNFAIDPSGTYLLAANQDSDSIVVFRIDAQTGGLTAVGQPTRVPKPVCLRMVKLPAK
jgi:6-phosphogluconolactonase